MKITKLVRAMGHIDSDLIAEAEVYKPMPKKFVFRSRYVAAVVAACIVFVLAVGIIKPYTGSYVSSTSANTSTSPGSPSDSRAHFFLGGKAYVFFDEYTYTLPEGFTLVGEVDPEGEPMADFAGNVQGEIYMSESDKTVAYLKPNDGDRYWKMELIEL